MSDIVYSTDSTWELKCEKCGNKQSECICNNSKYQSLEKQIAYISRDRKGRRGKTVTLIANLKGDLKSLQKELQKICASGGAIKNNIIEIQGDHLKKIRSVLEQKGCQVKQTGG